MRASSGLSLIEVVIAVAVLMIGVMAAAQLQGTSLRHTGLAQALNEVTRMARAELELQRHTATIISDLAEGEAAAPVETVVFDCVSTRPAGIDSCEVTVEPCTILQTSAATLVCGAEVPAPPAYRITVDVVGQRGAELSIATIATGMYVAGAAGGE